MISKITTLLANLYQWIATITLKTELLQLITENFKGKLSLTTILFGFGTLKANIPGVKRVLLG